MNQTTTVTTMSHNNNLKFWEDKLRNVVVDSEVFDLMNNATFRKSPTLRNSVATHFYGISYYIPHVLNRLASKLERPESMVEYLKISLDELGGMNGGKLNSDLFLEAIKEVKIDISSTPTRMWKNHLFELIDGQDTEQKVLGFNFGLESSAVEIIDFLIEVLGLNPEEVETIRQTKFFKIHKVAEEEHIAANLRNFERFCVSDEEKKEYLSSYDLAVQFWVDYWKVVLENNEVYA